MILNKPLSKKDRAEHMQTRTSHDKTAHDDSGEGRRHKRTGQSIALRTLPCWSNWCSSSSTLGIVPVVAAPSARRGGLALRLPATKKPGTKPEQNSLPALGASGTAFRTTTADEAAPDTGLG